MKTLKAKFSAFLFGAEGINGGDCFTDTYTSALWGLVLWFATFDKLGVPIYVFFLVWAAVMAWMWGTYLKKRKADQAEEAAYEAGKREQDAKSAAE